MGPIAAPIAAPIASAGVAYADVLAGLVANWPMNEGSGSTIIDTVTGNNGTIYGATWVNGRLSFDGVNDYVGCGNPNITGSITVAVWVKKSAHPTNNRGIFGRWWNYTGHLAKRCFDIVEQSSDYKPYWGISSDGTADSGKSKFAIAKTALSLNTWYFIVGTFVPSASVNIFINGLLETQETTGIPSSIYNPSETCAMGLTFDPSVYNRYHAGLISNVRIYNRALSAPEVLALYNFQKSQYP